ncbi:EpsG family protein [Muribaculum intestinale]|uniref:EpsG family protein n=1 Tax=Muribaculum intestinale TaxID=1796646 RepID=UPI000F494506|nr:EpsG family protein [Muribaculum intestinale]ROT03700.1 hypothetical protein EEL42_11900 [Muribaculaceae bacterium Isolate-100 (HZI)]RXE64099.1 hypothetical protein ED388_12690 [Muribaculaceae bacterium Isolate-007 (NCI)]
MMSESYVLSENIADVVFFLILLLSGYHVYTGHCRNKKASLSYVIYWGILIFLFSLYGYLDLDFYNYRYALKHYFHTHEEIHMEPVYFYIADITGSFMVWRAFIWGIATIIMIYTIKRFSLSYVSTYFFITILYAFSFYKLRSSIGTSILFLGLSYILIHRKNKKISSIVIGMILVCFSYFFHKSMPVALAIMLLACILPFNRISITCSLIAFPFLVTAVTNLIDAFIGYNYSVSSEQMSMAIESGTRYATSESATHNLNGIFRMVLSYTPIYMGLYLLTKDIIFRQTNYPIPVLYLYKYWYIMTYVASLFFLQEVSFWIYIRFLTMSFFPMALVLGYYYYTHRMTFIMKLLILIGILASLMDAFYPIFKRFA